MMMNLGAAICNIGVNHEAQPSVDLCQMRLLPAQGVPRASRVAKMAAATAGADPTKVVHKDKASIRLRE